MPTSSDDSPKRWPRCSDSELARQRAGLKAMHRAGLLRFASEEAAGAYDEKPAPTIASSLRDHIRKFKAK